MHKKSDLKCPNCGNPVCLTDLAECAECSLHLDRLDELAGAVPRHDSFVTDYQGAISSKEAQRLSAFLFRLGRQFPQASFFTFFFPPPEGLPHRLYAFWLANRGRFSPLTARGGKNFSVLLLIDCDRGVAVLTVGYGLERFLSETALASCLAQGHKRMERGDYAGAVYAVMSEVARLMKACAGKQNATQKLHQPLAEKGAADAF